MPGPTPLRSRTVFQLGCLALVLVAGCFVASPASARIKLPGGGGIGSGGIIIFDPGVGGGGGGGGGPDHPDELEALGYVCRPYLNGKRCDGYFADPTLPTADVSIYLCDVNQSCSASRGKSYPGKVSPDRYALWSFEFPSAAKLGDLGDFDHDGRADLVGFSDLHSAVGDVKLAFSNGVNEFSQTPVRWATSFCAGLQAQCAVGDVSADGRTDILSFDRASGNVTVAVSNGTSFVDTRVWSSTLGKVGGTFLVGDFDGDGAADAAAILPPGSTLGPAGSVFVSLNRRDTIVTRAAGIILPPPIILGPRIFRDATRWIGPLCPTPGECVVGDFNGDRRDDIARVRPGGDAFVALSAGAAFLPEQEWIFRIGPNPIAFRVADVNRDGFDDLVGLQADGSLTVAVSDGASFVATVDVQDMYCADPLGCSLADVNGDGNVDVVEIARGAIGSQRAGDTWVSLGAPLRGFPTPPPRPLLPDGDADGVPDAADNCTTVANTDQADADHDGIGDVCEHHADLNGDGFVNFADLALVRQAIFTTDPKADINHDGIVNFADLAILKNEFLKPPGPSNATKPPVIQLLAPVNGGFYDPGTRSIYVAGFLRNVSAVDALLQVKVAGSVHPLSVAADGFFSGFVSIDPNAILNPVLVVAQRKSNGQQTVERDVAILGRSVYLGEYSPSSLGARIEAWKLEDIAHFIAARLDVATLGFSNGGGPLQELHFQGQPSLDVIPGSDVVNIDVRFPGITARYRDSETTCTFNLTMTGVHAHLEYDLEPLPGDPSRVHAKELPGSPAVTFQGFSNDANPVCAAIAAIFTDAKKSAVEAVANGLRAGDFNQGPIDGKLEDAVNGIDLSGLLSSLGVTFGTRFRAVPEDLLGVAFDLDTGFAPSAACPTALCRPAPGAPGAGTRVYQTGAIHPPFPLFAPGGTLYDVSLGLAADTVNQLFTALSASGTLATYFQESAQVDLSKGDAAIVGGIAALSGLQKVLRLVPTLPPIATGLPGTAGSLTEIQMGQLLVEIPTLDDTDAFRMAIDVRASLDFSLVQPDVFVRPKELQVRVHDIQLLGAETLHVPAGVVPNFDSAVLFSLQKSLPTQQISFSYPLPRIAGVDLEPFGLTPQPGGGALVFGLLEIGGGPVVSQ